MKPDARFGGYDENSSCVLLIPTSGPGWKIWSEPSPSCTALVRLMESPSGVKGQISPFTWHEEWRRIEGRLWQVASESLKRLVEQAITPKVVSNRDPIRRTRQVDAEKRVATPPFKVVLDKTYRIRSP